MLGRCATNKPSSDAALSSSLRAVWRASLRSVATKTAHQRLQSQEIALRAEPSDHPDCQICDHRMPSLHLASKDVGQVYFDERYPDRQQGIAQGEARMSQGGGVDQS